MTTFRNIAAPLRVEIDKIKGSRFIADAAPVRTEGHIAAVLAGVHWGELTENVVDRVLAPQNLLLLWLICHHHHCCHHCLCLLLQLLSQWIFPFSVHHL